MQVQMPRAMSEKRRRILADIRRRHRSSGSLPRGLMSHAATRTRREQRRGGSGESAKTAGAKTAARLPFWTTSGHWVSDP